MVMTIHDVAGQAFTHQYLWNSASFLLSHPESKSRMEFRMAAMVMAYFSYEAYLNLIGARIDPAAWKDERKFFSRQPYRGTEGKLKRICEQIGIEIERDKRPYLTIRGLKTLRNFLAHGKHELYAYEAEVQMNQTPDIFHVSIYKMVTAKKTNDALKDTAEFLESLYAKIIEKHGRDKIEFRFKPFDFPLALANHKPPRPHWNP